MQASNYDSLPTNVKEVLWTFDEDLCAYKECKRIYVELEKIGWTCDWYLDGIIFDVRPIEGRQGLNISHSAQIEDKPSFNEWANYIHLSVRNQLPIQYYLQRH